MMNKKIKISLAEKQITREDLANPFKHLTHKEKLKKSNAIDLRNNHTLIDLENGYVKILPIDESKRFK